MQGPTLHILDLNSMPVIKEGMLVTDEFCAQYQVLKGGRDASRREYQASQDAGIFC
jgi:hypothetical protein